MERTEQPRQPLFDILIEANKRATVALDVTRALAGKLFGPSPEDTARQFPEMSISALSHRLVETLSELEDELGRLHNATGEINKGASSTAVQGRASGY